jgi:hypothetical protein
MDDANDKKPDPAIVARELDAAMKRRGLGTRVLSDRIEGAIGKVRGSSYASLDAYRKGTVKRPRREIVEAAAEALRVPVLRLLEGRGPLTEEDAKREAEQRSVLDTEVEAKLGQKWADEMQLVSNHFYPEGNLHFGWSINLLLVELATEYKRFVNPPGREDLYPGLDLIRNTVFAPLKALGVEPTNEGFRPYLRAMVLALELAPKAGRIVPRQNEEG